MAAYRLRRDARIIAGRRALLVRCDAATVSLEGSDRELALRLLLLLHGARDAASIEAEMGAYGTSALRIVEQLVEAGIVERVEPGDEAAVGNAAQTRYLAALGLSATASRLQDARVAIAGTARWGITAASGLASAGIGQIHFLGEPPRDGSVESLLEAAPCCQVTSGPLASDRPPDLLLAAYGELDLAEARELAIFGRARGIPVLHGWLGARESVIGPLVEPDRPPCWECARLRLLANATPFEEAQAMSEALLATHSTSPAGDPPLLAAWSALHGHAVALEALKLLAGDHGFAAKLRVLDLRTLETATHAIVPLPCCPVCGGAGASAGERPPLRLPEAATPERMRRALPGWIDPRTGIIRALVVGAGIGPLVHAVAELGSFTSGELPNAAPWIAAGKGLTEHDAVMSAVGEAIEYYSAMRFPGSGLLCRAPRDMVEPVFPPASLALYGDAQYRRSGFPYRPLDPDAPIDWARGEWLDTGETVWVPAIAVYLSHPQGRGQVFCQETSTGIAAGQSFADAAFRAALELIERDAFMTAWLCRRAGRKLGVVEDLSPELRRVWAQLAAHGAELALSRLDSVGEIPTVLCLGRGDGRSWPGLVASLGADPDPALAVEKALLEQGQRGLSLRHQMQRGAAIPPSPEAVTTLADHALYYLPPTRAGECDFLCGDGPALRLCDWPATTERTLADVVRAVGRSGSRLAAIDVTAPDVALSPFRVVRVVGLDLQPLHFGFGMERRGNPRLAGALRDDASEAIHPLS